MHAELKSIESNDHGLNWREWRPEDPTDVMHWFSINVGVQGSEASNIFQLPVATRKAIAKRRDRSKFRGLVLDPYESDKVEALLHEWVSGVTGENWDQIVDKLRQNALWEYGGYR